MVLPAGGGEDHRHIIVYEANEINSAEDKTGGYGSWMKKEGK